MFLPNKAKSIAAVALLSLGTLGSQILLTPKALGESASSSLSQPQVEDTNSQKSGLPDSITGTYTFTPGDCSATETLTFSSKKISNDTESDVYMIVDTVTYHENYYYDVTLNMEKSSGLRGTKENDPDFTGLRIIPNLPDEILVGALVDGTLLSKNWDVLKRCE